MGDNFELYSKGNLTSIEFDDQQIAKIGLALQAIANDINVDSSGRYVYTVNKTKCANERTTSELEQQIKYGTIASSVIVKAECEIQVNKNLLSEKGEACLEAQILNSLSQPQQQFEASNDSSTQFVLTKEEPQLQEFKIETPSVGEEALSASIQYPSTAFENEPIDIEHIGLNDNVLSIDSSSHEQNYESIDSIETDSQNEEEDHHVSAVFDYTGFIYYICPQCGVTCGRRKDWETHTEKKHMSNTMPWLNLSSLKKKNGESYYQCLDCNKKLSQKLQFTQLQAHRIKHLPHKDYIKCGLCHKGFSGSNIYKHIETFHDKIVRSDLQISYTKYIKIFCPICQQPQQNIKRWSYHLSKEHDYNKKLRVTQLNERMYSCQLCPQKLTKSSIRAHMLIHEPHKSFQCTLCEKYDTCMSSATRHLRLKHLSIDEKKKLYKCSHCKSTFAKKASLWNHNRKCHKNEILMCTLCDTEFLNDVDLLFHMNLTNHTMYRKDDGVVVLVTISKSTNKPNQLDGRFTKDSPTNVTLIKQEIKLQKDKIETSTTGYEEFLFNSNEEMSINVQYIADEGSDVQIENGSIEFESMDEENDKDEQETLKMGLSSFIHYICPECGEDCGSYSDWKSHTEKQHMSNKIFWLNLSATTNGNGELCYQCLDCENQFNAKSSFKKLQLHHITHLPHKEYIKCSFCNKRYDNHGTIYKHIKNNHRTLARQYSKKKISNPATAYIKIFCPICQQSQSTIKRWWQHLTEKHDYPNKIKSQAIQLNEYMHSCRICEKKIYRNSLRNHTLMHEPNKSFQCTLCKNYNTLSAAAIQHVREKHLDNDEKLLQCSYCQALCKDKKALWLHSRNCHKDEILKCSVCNKQFLNAAKLLSHIGLSNHTSALNDLLKPKYVQSKNSL